MAGQSLVDDAIVAIVIIVFGEVGAETRRWQGATCGHYFLECRCMDLVRDSNHMFEEDCGAAG